MAQAAVTELDPREVLKADAAAQKPFIMKRLLRFCSSRTEDKQQAKDMASEAVVLTLAAAGWHRWKHDGTTDPRESLLNHLCTMARDVLKKERERASSWREVEADPEHDAAAPPDSGRAPPGEKPVKWARQDDEMRMAEAVMERLDEDTRRMLRVESESDEDMDAETLAAKLGWTKKQVYRARERVAYHRDLVVAAARKKGGRP